MSFVFQLWQLEDFGKTIHKVFSNDIYIYIVIGEILLSVVQSKIILILYSYMAVFIEMNMITDNIFIFRFNLGTYTDANMVDTVESQQPIHF